MIMYNILSAKNLAPTFYSIFFSGSKSMSSKLNVLCIFEKKSLILNNWLKTLFNANVNAF